MQSSEAIVAEHVYWRFRTDVFDIENVPENVWIRIMTFCGLRDLLSLEQACTFYPNHNCLQRRINLRHFNRHVYFFGVWLSADRYGLGTFENSIKYVHRICIRDGLLTHSPDRSSAK